MYVFELILAHDINFMRTSCIAYPSNVMASAASNTSISLTWGVPAEFQSSIVNYRLNLDIILSFLVWILDQLYYACRIQCRNNSTGLNATALTVDSSTYSLTASSLSPYTTYTCCVEAIYTDSSENSMACDTITTLEGGELYYRENAHVPNEHTIYKMLSAWSANKFECCTITRKLSTSNLYLGSST
jgi:hypothetical protein